MSQHIVVEQGVARPHREAAADEGDDLRWRASHRRARYSPCSEGSLATGTKVPWPGAPDGRARALDGVDCGRSASRRTSHVKLSARNQLQGTVTSISRGEAIANVVI